MILAIRHDYDGRQIRVRLWSSKVDETMFSFLGMMAMDRTEFDEFSKAMVAGGAATGLKVTIEEDGTRNNPKDPRGGELRMPRD